ASDEDRSHSSVTDLIGGLDLKTLERFAMASNDSLLQTELLIARVRAYVFPSGIEAIRNIRGIQTTQTGEIRSAPDARWRIHIREDGPDQFHRDSVKPANPIGGQHASRILRVRQHGNADGYPSSKQGSRVDCVQSHKGQNPSADRSWCEACSDSR